MTKTILFRADGNATTGLGHLYRLFSLVEVVKKNYNFVFLTKEESTVEVIPKEYEIKTIPKYIRITEEPKWINSIFPSNSHCIIADGYHFDSNYQKQIKELGFKLVYIDDLAKEEMFADIVINHSLGLTESNYLKQVYTKFALGTSYALLRPSFLEIAKQNRVINKMDTAFVCFGGADPYNLTYKAVKALLRIDSIKNINVVLGGAYKHNELYNLNEDDQKSISIYKNLSEEALLSVMLQCDFAIAPASTILYELCCVKMPILSGYYVENQENIYNAITNSKAIYGCGDFRKCDISSFHIMIVDFLNNKNHLNQIRNQKKMFDGRSSNRLLGMINRLHFNLRKAEYDDMLTIFEWSSDNLVRKNSFNTEPIEIEQHKVWFENKLSDKNSLLLMASVNNLPAGLIRYEKKSDFSEVGILISKDFRGQGLASFLLEKSTLSYFEVFKDPIYAYIKKQNILSVKSFEKANYSYFKDEIIKGSPSFVYKLEKKDVKR